MLHFIQSSTGRRFTEAEAFFADQRRRPKVTLLIGAVVTLDLVSATLTVLAS